MSRLLRAGKAFAAGIVGTAVLTLFGFIATPLLLRWLGDEAYGCFRAASDWLGYLTLIDLALAGATVPLLAQAAATGDKAARAATLGASIRVSALSVVPLGLIGAILCFAMPRLVPSGGTLARDVQIGVSIGLVSLLVLPLAPFRTLAEIRQQGFGLHILLTAQGLVTTGASLMFASIGWGIAGQFLAVALGGLPAPLVLAWWGRTFEGAWRAALHGESQSAAAVLPKIASNLWPNLVLNLAGRISLLSDSLVIAFLLDPIVVVPFVLTQRLPALAQSVFALVGGASWAALVELRLRGETDVMNARLVEASALMATLGAAVAAPVFLLNQSFVIMWVGSSRYSGDLITALSLINGLLLGLFSLWSLVLRGLGYQSILSRIALLSAAVNIVASVTMTMYIGTSGPLCGTLLAFSLTYLWYFPLILRRDSSLGLRALGLAASKPLLLGALYTYGIRLLIGPDPVATWVGLMAYAVLAGMGYLCLAWFLLLDGTSRRVWFERITAQFRWSDSRECK